LKYKRSIFTPDTYENSYAYKLEDLKFPRMSIVGNPVNREELPLDSYVVYGQGHSSRLGKIITPLLYKAQPDFPVGVLYTPAFFFPCSHLSFREEPF
jgi:hypothetical protein